MNKVIDIFGKEIEFECMGCDIANHKLIPPGGYVYEDEFINISADPEIPIKGFMVLGINKHIKSLNEMTATERVNVVETLNKTIEVIKKSNIAKEVLLIQEEKANHFHIWIVPIHDWMDKFGRNVRNIKEIINYAKQNFNEDKKEELLQAIEDIKNGFEKINFK
jgi:diadenosine tetraphosphate (Ap4A) HIT family hydrolase